MSETDIDANGTYDNVEFPARKPGTGTWPRTAAGTASASGNPAVKLYGHQTVRAAGPPKLAPLVEIDGGEVENHKNVSFSSSSTSSSSLASGASASSVLFKPNSVQIKPQTSKTSKPTPAPMPPTQTQSSFKAGITSNTTSKTTLSSSSPVSTTIPLLSMTTTTTSASTTTPLLSMTTTTMSSPSPVVTKPLITTATKQNSEKDTKPLIEKETKPLIKVTNDNSLYMPAEVGSGDSQRKKKIVETEEEDFKRQDLNPASRKALEKVYTHHPDFYQLNTKVLDEGSLLKQDVLDIYRKTGETLTYEQLLQGMLVDGERFLLGSCWLYYTHVQFLDIEGKQVLREPYGKGRIGLTSKRALFLSTETYTDANLDEYGATEGPGGGYKLEVSKRSAVVFKNIPLGNFHSAEMEVITGTAAQTKISKEKNCCGCFAFKARWISTPPMTRSIASRVLRLGVSMPPWQTRMFLEVHLDPTMSLTVARDFISQLHAFAPHMH